MRRLQIGLAVVLLAAVGATAAMLAAGTEGKPAADDGPRFTHPSQCAECHSEIAAEVNESWHGIAYKDPDVLELSKNFTDTQCISCHAPVPIYSIGPGERVFERRERRETGVDCLSCHLRPDGTVAAVRGISPDAPCRPVVEPTLSRAVFCAGCHDQHWTVSEYLDSRWSETHTCNDCHMPRVDRPIADGGPVREGVATHRFEGGHYKWMLQKAATLAAEVKDGKLVVRVTNSGTGHKMPTDARHRSFNLFVSFRDEAGNLLVEPKEIAEYRLYYRDMNKESTQIAPFETRVHEVPLPEGASGTAHIEFVYCLKPPQKITKDWTVVETMQVDF